MSRCQASLCSALVSMAARCRTGMLRRIHIHGMPLEGGHEEASGTSNWTGIADAAPLRCFVVYILQRSRSTTLTTTGACPGCSVVLTLVVLGLQTISREIGRSALWVVAATNGLNRNRTLMSPTLTSVFAAPRVLVPSISRLWVDICFKYKLPRCSN